MSKELELICFGVGFGDCIYIKLPDSKQILIDTGHSDEFLNALIKLKTNGKNIDYVFLTHAHGDHIGGVKHLLEDKDLTLKGVFYWTPLDNKISITNLERLKELKKIAKSKTRMIHTEQIDSGVIKRLSEIFDNQVKVIYPITFGISAYNTHDLNANSIAIAIVVDGYNLLFMGDATFENEDQILNEHMGKSINFNNTVFWKIGHHASDTASGNNFVKSIMSKNFKKAVCSCKERWTMKGTNRKPPSIEKIKQINMELKKVSQSIDFTGKDYMKKDICLKFTFNGGKVSYATFELR